MKQYILPIAIAVLAGMAACKKDGTTTTITNTIRDTTITTSYATGMVNADTLTAGLKVAHGTNVAGTFPATAAGAPLLDTLYQGTYTVIKGRYLYIYPKAISGQVAGYYVQVTGASSYFKVDYTKAYGLRKQAVPGFRSDVEGYVDSAIVFKLPVDIKGDTFFVKYAAYDDQNRVSVPVTAGVLVSATEKAFSDSLSGKWRLDGMRVYQNGKFSTDTFVTNPLYTESYFNYYICNSNSQLEASSNITDIYLPYNKSYQGQFITFSGYNMIDSIRQINQVLNLDMSTCTKIVYDTTTNLNYLSFNLGYSYDRATKSFTMVRDQPSNMSLEFENYHVVELTDKTFIISANQNAYSDLNGPVIFIKFVR